MVTELLSRETSTVRPQPVIQRSPRPEPTVRQIIESARSAPAPSRGAWLAACSTGLMMWAAFMPVGWGPLGWACLVPLLMLVRLTRKTAWMYTATYGGGLIFTGLTLQWMRLGDPSMYLAWFALAFYMALYFPAFVFAARVAVHRLRLPLPLAAPVVWVGLEYLRGHLMTGFAWYYLGHTQFRWLELIQISDLVGAYGVSFLLAMMSACFVACLPEKPFAKLRLVPPPSSLSTRDKIVVPVAPVTPAANWRQVAICLTVFVCALAYGYVRRGQAEFREGPRVALIQGNFTTSLKHDPSAWVNIYRTHEALTGMTVRQQPDLVVWPETMFRVPLMMPDKSLTPDELARIAPEIPAERWHDPMVTDTLRDMSQMAGAAMMIGVDTLEIDKTGWRSYNSAAFVRPDTGLQGRYDKMHRVVFGEYIPLKDELPDLYRLTPFPNSFGIARGKSAKIFDYRGWTFAPIICFEDTVPHLVRGILNAAPNSQDGSKPVDCLVNLTNDGWFHGSSELDQHLITAAFRCVECRTPMVRAVNTGVSAVIDGDGMIVEPDVFIDGDGLGRTTMTDPKSGRWHKQLNAALVDTVPLDDRQSLYVTYGDWFSSLCCGCVVFLAFLGILPRKKKAAPVTA